MQGQEIAQCGMCLDVTATVCRCRRFNATSPFAGHTGEPSTPQGRSAPPLSVLDECTPQEADQALSIGSNRGYTRMSSWTGSATPDSQQQTRSASLEYISARASSLCNARNASILGSDSTSISSGRMQSIRRQMSLTLRQVSPAQQCTCQSATAQLWGLPQALHKGPSPCVCLHGSGVRCGQSH